MGKKLIGAVVVVVVVAGAAVWFFLYRDDPPEELSVDSRRDGGSESESKGTTPESFDGRWTVVTGGDTQAGLRITEDLTALPDHEAVGRTTEVEGSITIAGQEITEGDFTVDLTALEFTDSPPGLNVANRANAMRDRGLETDEFPEASFALTEPVTLDSVPADGETVTTEVTGELTLHGVTREVTFGVEAKVDGANVRVASAEPVPVVLADFDIEEPSAPFVADVGDEGSFEFLLVLEQG